MPNKNTFVIPPIQSLLDEEVRDGLWIDPFANQNRWATITNDLNPAYDTDYHLDALEFLHVFKDESVDGILFDPPYSPRQIKECYESVGLHLQGKESTQSRVWAKWKDEIARIVRPGGKVLSFGWNSQGIGKQRGFDMERVLLVPHGGIHNDTIVVIERKLGALLH